MDKLVYVDADNIVGAVEPAESEVFPGVTYTERYSKAFLDRCILIPDEVDVEPGMRYDRENGTFYWPEPPDAEEESRADG